MATTSPQASPELFFNTINAYQRTAALKAAIEIDLFTAIAEGNQTVEALASKCHGAARGMRILCDYMVIIGFLLKEGALYHLTADSASFLDRRSPAYLGGTLEFLLSPMLTEGFRDIAAIVRQGGTVVAGSGSLAPDHPVWVKFARAMAPLMSLPAQLLCELVPVTPGQPVRLLDIAAGHGMFGIKFAQCYPNVEVTALDWANVLAVAEENALKAGLAGRYRTIAGSAFEVTYGEGYDLVFLTNFLHHFDPSECGVLLKKVQAALISGGRAVALEFVPNEDRVSPHGVAAFSLAMLATTPNGDAYTFAELESMFRNAGFSRAELHQLPPTMQSAVIAHA